MHRTIKSFVLRTGRVSNRQQLALDEWVSDYELSSDKGVIDLASVFHRKAATIVEIGFGMGASLVTMAEENPDINFIGIEVHKAGVGSLVADLHDLNLTNVRVVNADAVGFLTHCIAPQTLAGIQIFFPDPWHKKKHNKRRLIQPLFVDLLVSKLVDGGFIHCATDWQDYALQMLAVIEAHPLLDNLSPCGDYIERPTTRPVTKFERRGERLGHGVWDLKWVVSRI